MLSGKTCVGRLTMAEPDLGLLQAMVQRVLDEQKAMRDDQKSFREFLELQFAMIRSRDFRIDGHEAELRVVEAMLGGHERRIAALEAKTPAE
jgi:hypothetical protein